MLKSVRSLVVSGFAVVSLGACTEVTQYFASGDPAEVSSCEFVLPDAETELEGALCAECNSGGTATASSSACGVQVSVRCNAPAGQEDLYGIAVGVHEEGSGLTGTAWIDEDDNGPDDGDALVCHEQGLDDLGKHEVKCTSALKGNGKEGAYTFEASIKYDPAKDTCI